MIEEVTEAEEIAEGEGEVAEEVQEVVEAAEAVVEEEAVGVQVCNFPIFQLNHQVVGVKRKGVIDRAAAPPKHQTFQDDDQVVNLNELEFEMPAKGFVILFFSFIDLIKVKLVPQPQHPQRVKRRPTKSLIKSLTKKIKRTKKINPTKSPKSESQTHPKEGKKDPKKRQNTPNKLRSRFCNNFRLETLLWYLIIS